MRLGFSYFWLYASDAPQLDWLVSDFSCRRSSIYHLYFRQHISAPGNKRLTTPDFDVAHAGVYTRLQKSAHGIGVFAIRDIPAIIPLTNQIY
jgi:hypothetical protein